jgi:hypothetical protein
MIWVLILSIVVIGFLIYFVWKWVQQNSSNNGSYVRITDTKSNSIFVEWGNGPVVNVSFKVSLQRKIFWVFWTTWSLVHTQPGSSTTSGSTWITGITPTGKLYRVKVEGDGILFGTDERFVP